ncbi:hypothetical protein QR98_0040660 [Sarcoptes scabiei]|uniref:Uncharacterized protein n=1 Tax=Sarcoptes scabiei TaxID=52283 RepID=A0A132A3R7_SARSC|nr:hypothetical protein QR98_0040660 [Sarcoptes scabiei]
MTDNLTEEIDAGRLRKRRPDENMLSYIRIFERWLHQNDWNDEGAAEIFRVMFNPPTGNDKIGKI